MSRNNEQARLITENAADIPFGQAPQLRLLPILYTSSVVFVALLFAWAMWNVYMGTPWTRDGTVRAFVLRVTPEISGRIVRLLVAQNSFVHKGDLLMEVDPTDYQNAFDSAQAAVAQAKANFENRRAEATRRLKLTSLSISSEEQQSFVAQEAMAQAAYSQSIAALAQARTNLDRTRIISPVNGYVTNLRAQVGDYATAGQSTLAIVDSDSFWIDGYFEETQLTDIRPNQTVHVRLMGRREVLVGHVASIARGISVPNAQPDASGLASVNPIFTWIRLSQRIPVQVVLDHVPDNAILAVGLTATVEIVSPKGSKWLLFPWR
jgi:multidrug resistance efflux pump